MKINRCVQCWRDFYADYKSNVCQICETEKEFGFPRLVETVSLHTMKNVSKTRLAEMDKRTMLPEADNGKDYAVGTKENGKIKDTTVDLRP